MAGTNYAVSGLISAEQSETREIKEMPASSWGVFKAAIGGKGKLFKLMFLSLLTTLGAFLGIYFYRNMLESIVYLGQSNPFSSNLGFGYPISIGVEEYVALKALDIKFTFFTLLIPSLLILGFVLSGVFYIAKRWTYTDADFNISRAFFVGVKKNAINFLIIFLLLGGVIFLFNYALKGIITSQINNGNSFILVFAIIVLCIVLGLYIVMALFMCSLSATYKMNFLQLIKNSFLLTFGSLRLLIRNIIMVILCFLPLAFLAISSISTFILMFYAFLGIMLSIVAFTVYSQWVFERVIVSNNSEVSFAYPDGGEGKPNAEAKIIESDTKAQSVESAEGEKAFSPTTNAFKNKNKKKNFSNPKKKKR